MSSAARTHRRSSWRGQKASQGNRRWIGRMLFTIAAVLLIAFFIYLLLRRRPDRELRTFLIHAGSYELGAVMPPMYASKASRLIRNQLNAMEVTGQSTTIGQFIEDDAQLAKPLEDLDDTVMVIVRGYVLRGDNGQPMIACSDLGTTESAAGKAQLQGVVPLERLLTRLSGDDTSLPSFEGYRVVVLDIEPLAALPRFGQYGDDIFSAIHDSVQQLSGPDAQRLWVMATRGPLQNAGWDHQAALPISTQTLLGGLSGDADLDDDQSVNLGELSQYMGARYKLLTRSSSMAAPEIGLFRGGLGQLSDAAEASSVLMTKVAKAVSPPEHDEPDGDTRSRSSASNRGDTVKATPVRFRPLEDEVIAGENLDSDRKDKDVRAADGKADKDNAADPDDAQPAVVPVPTFWDLRDRLESLSAAKASQHLHPIASVPQLWRKLVQTVLHAEVESLDPLALQTRAEFSDSVTSDLIALEESVQSQRPRRLGGDDARGITGQIQNLWLQTITDRLVSPRDDQVAAADQLQFAIAVGRTRQWSQSLYQIQAVICGGDLLSEDARLTQTLADAQRVLSRQTGENVDVLSMRRATQRIDDVLRSSDSAVREKIQQLQDDFGRVNEGTAWSVIRRAQAWLRSPLATGTQRRMLQDAIADLTIKSPSKDSIVTSSVSVSLAQQSTDRSLLAMTDQIKARYEQQTSPSEIADPANALDGAFGSKFLRAVSMAPKDVQPDEVTRPLVHSVAAIPRKRQLDVTLYDSSRRRIDQGLELESTTDSMEIAISPESKMKTQFRITCYGGGSAGEFDDPVIEATWKRDADARPDADGKSVIVTVSPRMVGRAQLDLEAFRHGDHRLKEVSIELEIKALDVAKDPELKQLTGTRMVTVKLPQKDRIRVAVQTDGLSKTVFSGEDNLPGGAWLRTFASRETKFDFQLFNDSGRAVDARVWLIAVAHPFLEDNVREYWPEVVVGKMSRLRGNVIADDGRVLPSILRGPRLLRGPVELKLAEGRTRTPLSWEPPADPDAKDEPVAALNKEASGDESPRDVSHGMALIVRLIDADGRMLPGEDQVIWLIPKPWSPEAYVDLTKVEFVRGEVQIAAELKSDLDGDNKPDTIPMIARTAVNVQWTENEQWEDFRLARSTDPVSLPLNLASGMPNVGQIEVVVAKGRETLVQLDVDGWPRAIMRSIAQRDGAKAKRRNRFDNVRFSSVEMDYGDRVPSRSDDDRPLGPTQIYSPNPEVPVIFRGRGKSLVTRIAADMTTDFYGDASPPELEIIEGNDRGSLFWTDRSVKTVAKAIKEKGSVVLLTTVDDLSVNWNSKAAKADADLQLRANLKVGGVTKRAAMQVTLDSTPPEIDGFRPDPARIKYNEKITYEIIGSDPDKGGASSGLESVVIGRDDDGDNRPDAAKPRPLGNAPLKVTFNAPDPGRHQIAVQIWDKAGLASKPRGSLLVVTPKPEPKPKAKKAPAPAMTPPASKPKPAKPVKPSKPKVTKRGPLEGKIDIGGTLRGTLVLSPVPDEKIDPKDGVLDISGSRPSFNFGNVPEGEYTLSFKGTRQGATITFSWSGLNIGKKHVLPAN